MKHRVIHTDKGELELILAGDLPEQEMDALFSLLLTMPEIFTRNNVGELIPTGIDVPFSRRIPLIARQLAIFNFFFQEYAFVNLDSVRVWVQLTNFEKHNVIIDYLKYHSFNIYQECALDDLDNELRKN